jgi:hypothetical protein
MKDVRFNVSLVASLPSIRCHPASDSFLQETTRLRELRRQVQLSLTRTQRVDSIDLINDSFDVGIDREYCCALQVNLQWPFDIQNRANY